jgi:hypothetical protein
MLPPERRRLETEAGEAALCVVSAAGICVLENTPSLIE